MLIDTRLLVPGINYKYCIALQITFYRFSMLPATALDNIHYTYVIRTHSYLNHENKKKFVGLALQ